MRMAWTNDANASPQMGEAFVSGQAGRFSVTIGQLPAAILHAAMQPIAARRVGAHIGVGRRRFVPT